jgi:hypothetical protein
MSVTLADIGNKNENFTASRWSWKAAMAIIESLNVVDESTIEMLRKGHMDVVISKSESKQIAIEIRERFIAKLNPKSRVYANLTITDEPDDGTVHRSSEDEWRNYSASKEWLETFADFCDTSDGFRIF